MALLGDSLRGRRVLVTQCEEFMGPALVEVFVEHQAEVVADARALADAGAAEAAVAAAGHIDVLVASAPSIMQHVKAGKVRGLGVTSKGPSAVVPELPAISATVPGYSFELWWGVLAPPNMPKELAASLNAEINKAIGAADFREILAREGTEPYVVTADEAARTVASEIDQWKKVAAGAGIKAE